MHARIALCVLAFVLQGCTIYRFSPARQSPPMPYQGVLRVTRTDSSTVDLRPPVDIVNDTIFGWVRPIGVEGLSRIGVARRDIRAVAERRVNWPLTVLSSAPLAYLGMGVAVVLFWEITGTNPYR
jgi:hypothetical protein